MGDEHDVKARETAEKLEAEMRRVEEAYGRLPLTEFADIIAAALREAVAAERKRAAGVVLEYAEQCKDDEPYWYAPALKILAAAIEGD
jgi:hypothetical protein